MGREREGWGLRRPGLDGGRPGPVVGGGPGVGGRRREEKREKGEEREEKREKGKESLDGRRPVVGGSGVRRRSWG
ncbi:hypothetical protein TIFTF001_036728 [Ficus carica]|uniref:Uncharacterized protein n=1 Tax=Ficus carica TaxID=3494 RepID=A0AA88JBJ9_FICCA|nr:hypothetical protein TIFTF001_036725 [Ficus carica]GMN67672.1 hypothetical protein TIFTF001_036728 [Ficus carica]